MVSLKDVAKLANVSLMTVSRVLNDPKRVKPETLARVQEAILALNYVPDLSARQVRRVGSRNKTIGVLALDTVTTPFSVEITLSIEETARAYGWNSFVVNMFTDDNPDDIVDLLLAHRPGGIIFTAMGLREVNIPPRLLEHPCVLANCENKGEPIASYIPDDEQGQYTAIQALLTAGYSRPLCLHLPVNHLATRRRRRGLIAPAVRPVSILTRLSTAICNMAMSTTGIFLRCCWRISIRGNRGLIRSSVVTTVLHLWCIRRC